MKVFNNKVYSVWHRDLRMYYTSKRRLSLDMFIFQSKKEAESHVSIAPDNIDTSKLEIIEFTLMEMKNEK